MLDAIEAILNNYLPGEYPRSILPVMSVPLTLLGLLERGPSHGYDLKRDYDAYFGLGKPLRGWPSRSRRSPTCRASCSPRWCWR
jgi:hypothetical protein